MLSKIRTVAAAVFLLFLTLLMCSACTAGKGSMVLLEDGQGTGFSMDLNGFTSHNQCGLFLAAGDAVQVEAERESGKIALSVRGNNGSEPYTGNDLQPGVFTITVSETDTYLFLITGFNATGRVVVKNLGDKAK